MALSGSSKASEISWLTSACEEWLESIGPAGSLQLEPQSHGECVLNQKYPKNKNEFDCKWAFLKSLHACMPTQEYCTNRLSQQKAQRSFPKSAESLPSTPKSTMLPSPEDPFPIVQQEVRAAWTSLSTNNISLSSAERERRIQALELDLTDLSEAIRIARHDRIHFNISEQELFSREAFVAEMRQNLDSLSRPSQLLHNGRRAQPSSADDTFIGDEMRQQQLIMDQQDEQLDHLASAVERIGALGRDMHIELEEQGEIMDDLGEEMHDTTSRMKRVRQNLDRFIAEAGPRQFCTIVALSITFLVLTFLVAVT